MSDQSKDAKLVEVLSALPSKEKSLGGMRATIARNLDAILGAVDKGYTYSEIAKQLSKADPELQINESTFRVYMAELRRSRRLPRKAKGKSTKKATANAMPKQTEMLGVSQSPEIVLVLPAVEPTYVENRPGDFEHAAIRNAGREA